MTETSTTTENNTRQWARANEIRRLSRSLSNDEIAFLRETWRLDNRHRTMEVAVVLDKALTPMLWHVPQDGNSGYIPDTVDLWQFLWENQKDVLGVAHTHPWAGTAAPSMTDLTTFQAIDSGLGRNLHWLIITFNRILVLHRENGEMTKDADLTNTILQLAPTTRAWISEIRARSGYLKSTP
jgi:hypothetical protein